MGDEIRPFKIHVSEADLEDLKKRLRATRWPGPQTVPDWSQGVPLDYMQKICEYEGGFMKRNRAFGGLPVAAPHVALAVSRRSLFSIDEPAWSFAAGDVRSSSDFLAIKRRKTV